MNHVFVGPKLKVERAYQHILDLESRVADFAAHKSNTIVTKKDATGLDVVVFEGDEPLPALISLCVGDAAHNLRSALDHVMTGLVMKLVPGCANNHIYFPIRDDRAGVEAALKNAEVGAAMATEVGKKIGTAILEFVEPYGARDRPFPMLNKLDNIDKHRLVLTMAVRRSLHIETAKAGNLTITNSRLFSPGNKPLISGASLEGEFKPSIEVLLDEAELPKNEPVIPTLKNLAEVVSKAIEAVERAAT